MITNYLKIAYRNLLKQKLNSLINFSGLAIGIACTMVILLHITDELSYDKGYAKSDRIYRVIYGSREGAGRKWAAASPVLADEMKKFFPEVEEFFRAARVRTEVLSSEEKGVRSITFEENDGIYADSTAFKVFDLEMIDGDPNSALNQINSMVLTESTAKRYFPDSDPMGKYLSIGSGRGKYLVTGIIKDVDFNTHLKFDYMVSMRTFFVRAGGMAQSRQWSGAYNYLLLNDAASVENVRAKMEDFVGEFFASLGTREEIIAALTFILQPIEDVHLYSNFEKDYAENGDAKSIQMFGAIALLILFIACANFVNISTGSALKRFKEVGVRKVIGATRKQLMIQFYYETFLMILLSSLAAILVFQISMPFYNMIMQKSLGLSFFGETKYVLMYFSGVMCLGLFAGLYPAAFVSGFRPIELLRSKVDQGFLSTLIKKGLVVFQFAISVIMIFSTIVVYTQMNYLKNMDLGFDKEQVVAIKWNDRSQENLATIKNELLKNPNILNVATISQLIGDRFGMETLQFDGSIEVNDDMPSLRFVRADEDFVETMGLALIEGENFTKGSDGLKFLLNESAAKAIGLKNTIGTPAKNLYDQPGTIVGVVKDFNFSSLHNGIEPLVIEYNPRRTGSLLVKISPNTTQSLEFIESTINRISPTNLFNFTFIDEKLDSLYKKEQRMETLFNVFSILAIFISCLGLFGLASFTTELRVKEVGIRKVLGASVSTIYFEISGDFLKWSGLALVLGIPAAIYIMSDWLSTFAYRIDIGILPVVLTSAIALLVATAAVSYQSIKAAVSKPIDSLRYE